MPAGQRRGLGVERVSMSFALFLGGMNLAYRRCDCRSRRIKCDEGRPRCRRCITSDRACVYNDPPVASSRYALLLPKPAQLLQEVLLNATSTMGSPDAMHLDFFRHYTIKELPGSELEFPWSEVLLSAGIGEPVFLSMAALGSMHRVQSGLSPDMPSGTISCSEPYELYQKAVVALRKYIDRTPEVGLAAASETALITIVLLFCFEVLCGNEQNGGKHLTAAFAILSKLQGHFQGAPSCRKILASPGIELLRCNCTRVRSCLRRF